MWIVTNDIKAHDSNGKRLTLRKGVMIRSIMYGDVGSWLTSVVGSVYIVDTFDAVNSVAPMPNHHTD